MRLKRLQRNMDDAIVSCLQTVTPALFPGLTGGFPEMAHSCRPEPLRSLTVNEHP